MIAAALKVEALEKCGLAAMLNGLSAWRMAGRSPQPHKGKLESIARYQSSKGQ
jgi:hypothetical protein